MTPAPRLITAAQAMDRLRSAGAEWAFIDLREPGEVAEGHPFGSVNVPFSRLELDFRAIVPRPAAPVVLFDAGDGVAERAAGILVVAGWSDLTLVDGGCPGWVAAGLPLFKGEHSFSKAFGEWVQHSLGVPEIGPDDLAARMAGPDAPLVIDARPLAEHRAFTLPGSVNCPNGEIGLRLPVAMAGGQAVVVHCAGRTRSIIGAQTLRDFGIADHALALRDGTQGWELSGRLRDLGADRALPPPDDAAGAVALARAVMARHGLPGVTADQTTRWAADGGRTTFFLDPRPEDEGDTPPGFRRVPATTLIQQTDRYIGVRRARVVLWDPLLSRAVFAALWLRRMGFEAHVLTEAPPALAPHPDIALPDLALPIPSAGLAATGIDAILDLRPAPAHRAAHPAGARRGLRPRLPRLDLPARGTIALIADSLPQATLVATDLHRAGHKIAGVCTEGPADWRAAGLDVITDTPPDPDRDIDEVRFCAGRHRGNLDDARAYLAWETGLLDRLSATGLNPWHAPPTLHHKIAGA